MASAECYLCSRFGSSRFVADTNSSLLLPPTRPPEGVGGVRGKFATRNKLAIVSMKALPRRYRATFQVKVEFMSDEKLSYCQGLADGKLS